MTIERKKTLSVTIEVPVVIEAAADTAITESIERTDLLEAAVDAVSIQGSVTMVIAATIGTMTMIAGVAEIAMTMKTIVSDHVATVDAERSIRSVATEAAVKAIVTTMTTIPTRIDAGPEAEMKGVIGSLLDTATTRAEDMPMSSRRKEPCFDQRFLSCLLNQLVRPIATTARMMYELIV